VMRFKLATEGWLDPSTVRVFLDVINNDQTASAPLPPATWPQTKVLRPLGPVHAFFKRLRITMRGVVIEDIMDFNRVSEMFDLCTPTANRVNNLAEGFGNNWFNDRLANPKDIKGISTYQTVCFKPLCGIFMQSKFIPLRYCPLEIELELADMDDPIISSNVGIPVAADAGYFTASNSILWKLQQCQLKADLCVLDNQLDNSYVNHLLQGKPLVMVYNTFISNIQTIVSPDHQINVSRALSRLKTVFLSLERNLAGERIKWWTKNWNTFYSPMAINTMTTQTTNVPDNEITSLQLQIGATVIPQYPIRSHAECYYTLKKALGLASNNYVSLDIDGNDYRNNKFIVGIDCEKILGLSFTGTNTKNSLMTVRMKTLAANQADRFHILLTAEMVLEIGDSGITTYD